jgi:hypothetical protein
MVVKSGAYKLEYACRLNILVDVGTNTSSKATNRAVSNATLTDSPLSLVASGLYQAELFIHPSRRVAPAATTC